MKRRQFVVAGTGLLASSTLAALSGCLGDDRLDERGEIEVVVDGEPVDLSADRFQSEHAQNDSAAFHLHDGEDRWFMEGTERVTVAEAIDLLPHFAYTGDGGDRVVTVDGSTYDTGDADTEIAFLIDGEPVDPEEYELQDGDSLRVEIETGA